MPNIQIQFTTKAQLEGARAVEAQLDKQIGKLKAAGKETAKLAELEKQHSQLQASIATSSKALNLNPQDDDPGDGNGKGVKSWIYNLKALKKEAGGLPIVGDAIMMLKHPVVAVGLALGAAVGAWQKWREALKEQAELRETANRLRDLNLELSDIEPAAERAKEAFGQTLAKLREDAALTAGSFNTVVESINSVAEAEKSLSKARSEVALKQLDIDKAGGTITDDEYQRRKHAITGGTREEQLKITRQQRAAIIEATKAEAARSEAASGLLESRAGDLQNQITGRKGELERQLKPSAAQAQKAFESRLEKWAGAYGGSIAGMESRQAELRAIPGGGAALGMMQALELGRLDKRIPALKRMQSQAEQTKQELTVAEEELKRLEGEQSKLASEAEKAATESGKKSADAIRLEEEDKRLEVLEATLENLERQKERAETLTERAKAYTEERKKLEEQLKQLDEKYKQAEKGNKPVEADEIFRQQNDVNERLDTMPLPPTSGDAAAREVRALTEAVTGAFAMVADEQDRLANELASARSAIEQMRRNREAA